MATRACRAVRGDFYGVEGAGPRRCMLDQPQFETSIKLSLGHEFALMTTRHLDKALQSNLCQFAAVAVTNNAERPRRLDERIIGTPAAAL